jgi:PIN domain nuclease of toxin-antitoxin system
MLHSSNADPFDRMLGAHGAEENLPTITPDKKIGPYPVNILWMRIADLLP